MPEHKWTKLITTQNIVVVAAVVAVLGFLPIHYVSNLGFMWNVMHGSILLTDACAESFAFAYGCVSIPYRLVLGVDIAAAAIVFILRDRLAPSKTK